MSGRKYSQIALEKDRAERLGLLASLEDVKGRLRGVETQVRNMLDRVPQGVKDTFKSEVAQATNWLESSQQGQSSLRLDMSSATGQVRQAVSTAEGEASAGERTLAALSEAFNQRASAMEKALSLRLTQAESRFHGYKDALNAWFQRDAVREMEGSLESARSLLNKRSLQDADGALRRVELTLKAREEELQKLEEQHQKRLYVLKGLRQVCVEMGFEESEPRRENGGRRGRIIYEVDTLDQGVVVFYLSLDGISADSAIVDGKCLDEFDKLSELLQKEFGVKTRFKLEDGRPDEDLIKPGELDQPEEAHIERTA